MNAITGLAYYKLTVLNKNQESVGRLGGAIKQGTVLLQSWYNGFDGMLYNETVLNFANTDILKADH